MTMYMTTKPIHFLPEVKFKSHITSIHNFVLETIV